MKFKEAKLNDLYNFSSGLSKGKKYFGYGYPFLSFKTIFNSYYLPNELDDLVDSTEKEREKCSIKRGDVFLTRTSETVDEIGTSCVALKNYPNATFNGFSKRLRPINDKILPEYAAYYFRSHFFRKKASSLCTIITRASLNNDDLSYLTILYPEIVVQKKIASLLISYDKFIENNIRQIEILEEMAQRIYKEWFVDFKYPGHENDKLVDSELGMIPMGWEVLNIKDLIQFSGGAQPPKKEHIYNFREGYVRFIQNRDYNNYLNNKHSTYIKDSLRNKLCSKYDILIDKYGDVGRVRFGIEGAHNVALAKLIPKDENLREFLRSYFNQNKVRKFLSNSSQASTRGSLNSTHFNFLILKPSQELLKRWENFGYSINKYILQLIEKNKNLNDTRDYLLPKLTLGKVDLTDLEIDTSILDD
jgi:type I restriction enzyme, S subunit